MLWVHNFKKTKKLDAAAILRMRALMRNRDFFYVALGGM
jgi:hypothetical protein